MFFAFKFDRIFQVAVTFHVSNHNLRWQILQHPINWHRPAALKSSGISFTVSGGRKVLLLQIVRTTPLNAQNPFTPVSPPPVKTLAVNARGPRLISNRVYMKQMIVNDVESFFVQPDHCSYNIQHCKTFVWIVRLIPFRHLLCQRQPVIHSRCVTICKCYV